MSHEKLSFRSGFGSDFDSVQGTLPNIHLKQLLVRGPDQPELFLYRGAGAVKTWPLLAPPHKLTQIITKPPHKLFLPNVLQNCFSSNREVAPHETSESLFRSRCHTCNFCPTKKTPKLCAYKFIITF